MSDESKQCPTCWGTGYVDAMDECETCDASGRVWSDEKPELFTNQDKKGSPDA